MLIDTDFLPNSLDYLYINVYIYPAIFPVEENTTLSAELRLTSCVQSGWTDSYPIFIKQ